MIDFSHFNSIIELTSYFNSEEKCKKVIFESRWNKHDVVCPFCGQRHCTTRTDGRFHCSHCKANFSVTVGTIFENTKIPLVKWFLAMYLISCHKKGISSVQLATDIHVTQKTAWYILHKVRTLYKQDDNVQLYGLVECDEMYLGGRETNKHESKKTAKTQGRSTKTKTPIFGMTMVWKTEDVNELTGEVKEKTHTYEVAMKVTHPSGMQFLSPQWDRGPASQDSTECGYFTSGALGSSLVLHFSTREGVWVVNLEWVLNSGSTMSKLYDPGPFNRNLFPICEIGTRIQSCCAS